MMKSVRFTLHQRQTGLSLIELSLLIVVLGIATVVVGHLHITRMEKLALSDFSEEAVAAHNAVLGFIYANSRLPCPSMTPGGQEDCSRTSGYLPEGSLGIISTHPGQTSYPLRYTLYNHSRIAGSDDAWNLNLSELANRFRIFAPDRYEASPSAISSGWRDLGNENTLDLCQALQDGSATDSDPIAYMIFTAEPAGRDDAPRLAKDEGNATRQAARSGAQHSMASYSSRVSPVYFSTLWEDLGCASVLSTTGRSLPNILTSAVMYQYTLKEYADFLQLRSELAYADKLSATAALNSAISAESLAIGEIATATSSSINTAGVSAPAVGLASAGLVSATVALATAITAEVEAVSIEEDMKNHVDLMKGLQDRFDSIAQRMRCRVASAEKAGLYLNYQELEGDDCHF